MLQIQGPALPLDRRGPRALGHRVPHPPTVSRRLVRGTSNNQPQTPSRKHCYKMAA